MSRYHIASAGLSRAAGKTVRGHYESKLEEVIEPLRGKALQFAVLLLHRLVEVYRWAVVLTETDGGQAVHMTNTPWAAGDPTDPRGAHEIRVWTADNRAEIMGLIVKRRALAGFLEGELDRIIGDVGRTGSWLEKGMKILAGHIEKGKADRPSRGGRVADMVDPFFLGKAPGVKWEYKSLFKGNPDADIRTIEEMMRMYKHGPSRSAMRPLRLSDENWRAAKLLDIRIREMRSRSLKSWAASLVEKVDEEGKEKGGPTFQEALDSLVNACAAALSADEEMLSVEWDALREAGHPEAAQGATVPEALRKIGVRKTKRKSRAYWRALRKRIKATDFMDDVLKSVVRYKRDKLGRFTK
jgi:hypothetical protein